MTQERPDPKAFIDSYGIEAEVKFDNGMRMTLGQALDFEQMACTAEDVARQDPVKRVGFLAMRLAAAGSLRPEDEYLLDGTE